MVNIHLHFDIYTTSASTDMFGTSNDGRGISFMVFDWIRKDYVLVII